MADCTQTNQLIAGFEADALLGDKAYGTDAVVHEAQRRGIKPIIPTKSNRKIQRDDDRYVYQMRHVVENALLHLKLWRGIATRYTKKASSFLAIV